jgi:hypothetical protein
MRQIGACDDADGSPIGVDDRQSIYPPLYKES